MKHFSISMILLFSLFTSNLSGQETNPSFLKLFSLEGGGGYHLPISPDKDISITDYAGFRSFYIGANLALTDLWGLRMTYANNAFTDKNINSSKFTIHKLMAEVTLNTLQSIQSQRNPFEIVAHSGVGISMGKDSHFSDVDKMGNFQIGLMPVYSISKNFSIQLDGTYVINIKQNQGYNGQYLYEDVRDVIGSYLTVNIGLGVKFDF